MIVNTNLKPAQYKKLSDLVYRESGIVLSEKKLELLRARLAKRMRSLKIASPSDYIHLIDQNGNEFDRFIDAVTTNHTFFFRENRHCEYMINALDKKEPLNIWSAASSSGEEAYSIAVQLMANAFRFSIFASDISDSMLAKAERGIYPKERLRSVPMNIIRNYFQKGKQKWEDYVRIKPIVKEHVSFGKYNLISDGPFDKFDIIFCRNVMIYFDNPTKQNVVANLTRSLKPGGYFFVGMSESLQGLDHQLINVIPSGYRKKK